MDLPIRSGTYEVAHGWRKVEYGHGALDSLPGELERLGRKRAFLVTTRSLVKQGALLELVTGALGKTLVGTFANCRQHVPRRSVLEAAEAARAVDPDVIVSFGGGSVNDTARGVALALSEGIRDYAQFDNYFVRFEYPDTIEVPELHNQPPPQIALPTTLSSAEYTCAMGITSEDDGRKDVYQADALAASVVLLDPRLTAATPPRLWGSTGIKAMSDSIEQIYSRRANAMVETATLRAVEWFYRYLPASMQQNTPEAGEEARLRCLIAAWFANSGMFQANTMVGVGAGLRHQLGSMFDIPHGEAACVLLPHVLRFNASAVPDHFGLLARAIGVPISGDGSETAENVAAAVATFIEHLGLPTRLSALGVEAGRLQVVAEYAMQDFTMGTNPRLVESTDQLLALLQAAL